MKRALVFLLVSACGGAGARAPQATPPIVGGGVEKALAELLAGRFGAARSESERALAANHADARAAAVHAITIFQETMHELITTLVRVGEEARDGFDHAAVRAALEAADRGLATVDADLAIVAADPGFSLDLCLACIKHDWNRNGRVDDRDARLFQIEIDEKGDELPDNDPRRKPTFRFDVGDAHWARAMVSFGRSVIHLALAYKWTEVDKVLASIFGSAPVVRIFIDDRTHVARARDLVLAGLDESLAARAAYLAETDDQGEWVPNPTQKNHPLPLPVDQALYDTWGGAVADMKKLVAGDEGLDVGEIAQLGDHKWKKPPTGFLDVGRMLSAPRDIVIDGPALEKSDPEKEPERFMRSLFGEYYVTKMKPSGLIKRLVRMKGELDRNEDTLERKLRYLFWIN